MKRPVSSCLTYLTVWLFLLPLAFFLLFNGCGGSSSGPVNPVLTVAFGSTAAVDGSNTPNAAANIWQVKTDGSAAVPLTKLTTAAGGSVFFPTWSPDGNKLAFISTRALDGSNTANANSTPNVWVMNVDGSGATPLTKLTANGLMVGRPEWSPDGRKLVFPSSRALDGSDAVNTNSVVNIWVINADGSGATPVTRLTVLTSVLSVWTAQDPSWSPDSKKIAFNSAASLDGSDALNP